MNEIVIFFFILLIILLLLLILEEPFEDMNGIDITSKSIKDGILTKEIICLKQNGNNLSPQLSFSHPINEEIKSYALLLEDLDSPGPNSQTTNWIHWCVPYISTIKDELGNIINQVHINSIEKEGKQQLKLGVEQRNVIQGMNSWDIYGYRGPCPPLGSVHRYKLSIWALDIEIRDYKCTGNLLKEKIKNHILYSGLMTSKYQSKLSPS